MTTGTILLLAVSWGLMSVVAYLLFKWSWLQELDWTRSDRAHLVAFSLWGPASLLAAVFSSWPFVFKSEKGQEVLIERRK